MMKFARKQQIGIALLAVTCVALAGIAVAWLDGAGVRIQGGVVLSQTEQMLTIRCISPDVVVSADNFGGVIAFTNTFPSSVVQGMEALAVRNGSTISVDTDGSKDSYHLTTPDSDSFQFAVMGDSQGHNEILSAALNASLGCEFIIHCGDLTPSGRGSEFDALAEVLAETDIPIFTTPGNHDVKDAGDAYYISRFAPMSYSFEYSGITFAFVDSSDLNISEEEIEWMKTLLSGANRKVVVTHASTYDPFGYDHTLDPASCDRFQKFILDEDVDVVFTGHIHAFHQMKAETTDLIITGGAGAPLVDGVHHIVVANVSQDGITYEKIDLEQSWMTQSCVRVVGRTGSLLNLTYEELLSMEGSIAGYSSYENQFGNIGGQGDYLGVTIRQLVEQVGGMMEGDILRITASDTYMAEFGYLNVCPDDTWLELQGEMILALQCDGVAVPDWEEGPRIAFMPEDGLYSNLDCEQTSYEGQGYWINPSAGARWVRNVFVIEVVTS